MFFSLACGGETPSGPSRAYAPGFRMRKDKSPNPSRTRLSRILAQPNPFFSPLLQPKPPSAHLGAVRRRTFAPRQVLHPIFLLLNLFFFYYYYSTRCQILVFPRAGSVPATFEINLACSPRG